MKVAIIYDRVNSFGGAERVLLLLHKLWPEAPLFTSVYDPVGAPWAKNFDVRTSFLQRIPFTSRSHRLLGWMMPVAFEMLDLSGFDVVISVSSEAAKNVITRPGQLHICYCLTPTRYLWSGREEYQERPGLGIMSSVAGSGLRFLGDRLRRWDRIAASRPDVYVAISERVAGRISEYYQRTAEAVIYPPVDTSGFGFDRQLKKTGSDNFLAVSRFVGYKRLDIVIAACNALRLPLVVIGRGPAESSLRELAGPTVKIVTGHLTDTELGAYYRSCRAFLSAADEDFGIAAVEAQAAGKPVVCYGQSGTAEIVRDGITGTVFEQQTVDSLTAALERCMKNEYTPDLCVKNAVRFDARVFETAMKQFVEDQFREKGGS